MNNLQQYSMKKIPAEITKSLGAGFNTLAGISRPQRKGKYISCKVCNKIFYVSFARSKIRKYCSYKCSYKSKKKQKIKCICKMCSKEFSVIPSIVERGWGKFCSKQCSSKYKTKEKTVIKFCENCGKRIRLWSSRTKSNINFCSTKCMGEWRKGKHRKPKIRRICKTCNKIFYVFPCRIKKRSGRYCSLGCLAIWRIKHSRKKNTFIEIVIEKELIKQKIKYKKQIPIPIAHTVVDFLLSDKIVVYCDGDWWHRNTQNKDMNQDTLLTLSGYKVFVFLERRLKNQ